MVHVRKIVLVLFTKKNDSLHGNFLFFSVIQRWQFRSRLHNEIKQDQLPSKMLNLYPCCHKSALLSKTVQLGLDRNIHTYILRHITRVHWAVFFKIIVTI